MRITDRQVGRHPVRLAPNTKVMITFASKLKLALAQVNETGFIFPAADNRENHLNVVDSGVCPR